MNDDRQAAFNLSVNDTYSVDWLYTARHTKDWNTKHVAYRPPPSYIKETIHYNPDTGKMHWKERKNDKRFNANRAGKEVRFDRYQRNGVSIRVDGHKVKIYHHHIAWCIFYGEWPDRNLVIDHINGNHYDNRIVNLRLVTIKENCKNKSLPRNNTSGHQGVFFNKRDDKWYASIYAGNKRIHLGIFSNKDDAIAARKAEEIKYGYHENHGRKASDVRGDRYGVREED